MAVENLKRILMAVKYNFLKKIFGYFSLFFVLFQILSHYSNTDGSHCLREDVKRIVDKVFSEELIVYIASTLCRTFLLSFWSLSVVVTVFIVNDLLYCLIDILWMTNFLVVLSKHNFAYLLASVES